MQQTCDKSSSKAFGKSLPCISKIGCSNVNRSDTIKVVVPMPLAWKLLMGCLALIVLAGILLSGWHLRTNQQSAIHPPAVSVNGNLSQKQLVLTPPPRDMLTSLLSPVTSLSPIIDKDTSWPFSTQYAGLRALHGNSTTSAANRDMPNGKEARSV